MRLLFGAASTAAADAGRRLGTRRWRCCSRCSRIRRSEGRPRPEVRRHRAGAARRRAARPRRPTRCWRATCSTRRGRAIRSRSSRSSTPATRRCARKTSAAGAPRRCRSARSRWRRRWTTPASAPIWRCSSSRRCAGCSRQDELEPLYRDLEMPLIPVLVDIERAGIRVDGPRAVRAVAARRAGAGDAQRADLRDGRRGVQHQLAAAAVADPVRQAAAAGR